MKRKSSSQVASLRTRILIVPILFVAGIVLALPRHGIFHSAEARLPNQIERLKNLVNGVASTPTPCSIFAYVPNSGSNNISVIDTSTNTVVATMPALETAPNGVAVNPAGTRAYVANSLHPSASVVDTFHNWIFYVIVNGMGSDPWAWRSLRMAHASMWRIRAAELALSQSSIPQIIQSSELLADWFIPTVWR